MTEQEKLPDKEQDKGELKYAHRFASERQMHENRLFWTRIAALLTGNSLLVAGFAMLYESPMGNDATWLLLAIAAAGILIQAMWPLFAAYSYASDRYWSKLMIYTEEEDKKEILDPARQIWESHSRALKRLMDKPAGFWATVVFFLSFFGIWITAAVVVHKCFGIWIAVAIGILVFLVGIRRWCFYKRAEDEIKQAFRQDVA